MQGAFEVTENEIDDDTGRRYRTFGIKIVSEAGEVLDVYESVFFDEASAKDFVHLCNAEGLDPRQLSDVLEDIL